MEIRQGDLERPEVSALLADHVAEAQHHSPAEYVFALDVDALRAPDITVWTVWNDEDLAGMGALRELDNGHGEIKSMRTLPGFLRQGVGSKVLRRAIMVARARGYSRLSLETGTAASYAPAHALYLRYGFSFCGPFEPYTANPHSRFMTKRLITS